MDQASGKCSHCGAPLAGNLPAGLCLSCLLELGLRDAPPPDSQPDADAPMPAIDEAFDGYRIIEKLGEGGCGVVYRAEQLAPVRREVALKVIKLGMDTRTVIARFEAERQALAVMDHPNIARVFDAGATNGGRPFFAMELVEGEPITSYCDRNELSLAERLELFSQICLAIQHAHHKGVIHRDIKPSNILVSERDGEAVPKVIDFGVAKATEKQPLPGETVYTAFDQFIGTPAYMSPEQANLAGGDVDARSDIYSLGVLLYELLTGHPPFSPAQLAKAALHEACRIIREEEPVRPSARIASLPTDELAATARRRLLPASKFAPALRGDLDWLVMKALEKDRSRRYHTANDFAADVTRLLANEPISARPPGNWYRLQKFARRHRTLVISVGTVLLAVLAGLAMSTWLYFREHAARHAAEERAYASDMGLASRLAAQPVGLGGVDRLLDAWPDRRPDQRGWEWYYLDGLCHEDVLTIHADSNALNSVAWSPDGTRLASGGNSGWVRLWDATSGALVANLSGHTGAVNGVAWSRDGQLASCGEDGTVRLWDLPNAKATATLQTSNAHFNSLAWSPDARTIATGGRGGAVRLWDAATGAELKVLRHNRGIAAACWSHDGSRLASVGSGEALALWDVATGRRLFDIAPKSGAGSFLAVAWSPDDSTLATGGEDFTVRLYDAAAGTNTATCWGHHSGIASVAWNCDGTRLASADKGDGTVRIWDVARARMIRSLRGHRGPARSVAWSPIGSRVASAGSDGTIRIWDAERDNRSLRPLRHPNQVLSLAWHPDGRRLAAAGRHDSAVIWDTQSPARPLELHSAVNWVWRVAWKPDGAQLATVGDDSVIRLWTADGKATGQLTVRGGDIRALAWSPDGKQLACSGSSGGLKLWDTHSTNTVTLLVATNAAGHALAWSPNGRHLAMAVGPRITILATDNGFQPRHTLSGHTENVRSLAWSSDSKQLASAGDDSLVKVWRAEDGRELHTLIGYNAPVWAVAWSPDGQRLATGGWDGVVKLWDPESGIEICSFSDHPAQAAAVAFSPDGTRLASSDLDGNIFIRDATPGLDIEIRRRPASPRPATKAATPPRSTKRDPGAEMETLAWYRDTAERFTQRGDLHSHRLLVRFLADCPFPELRDGRRAVELGEQAATLSLRNNAGILDDLAAAYAEAGNYARAAAVQTEAIALLNGPMAKAEFTTRLRLYEANTPCRDYNW